MNLNIEQIIRRVPMFSGLPHREIKSLAELLRPCEFEQNTLIFREGETGDQFYILIDGQVEIIKALGTADERLLGVRKGGSSLGEMSLFNRNSLRTASVRALTQLQMLEMTCAEFDTLLKKEPTLAYEIVRTLSKRLEEAENLTIRDLQEKNRQLTIAYQKLESAQAQIIEKEKLEHELKLASKIQRGMLPTTFPQLQKYDFGALIKPMRAVGGDFFDFIFLDDESIGIAIGDVSGHSISAAFFMALTVSLLRAETRRSRSPRDTLLSVNRQLLEVNNTNMFVTILYGVLNHVSGQFTYVRAGHQEPIVYDEHGKQNIPSRARGRMLGLFDNINLDEQAIMMTPGNTLFLYTDGVNEARNAHRTMFGETRLKKVLGEHCVSSAQAVCKQVFNQVTAYRGAVEQEDDITLVAVKAR